MTRSPYQKIITSSLNKDQYIEFLQFCKMKDISKYEAVKVATIAYCKIKSPDKTGGMRKNIDEELRDLMENL